MLLLGTTLCGQGSYAVFFGFNLGSVVYNHKDVRDVVDVANKTGITVGGEAYIGRILLGAAWVQRGGISEYDGPDDRFSWDDLYNYLAITCALRVTPFDRLALIGGGVYNQGLGGIRSAMNDHISIDADELSIDYGPLAAVEYELNSELGFRLSYYWGQADVMVDWTGQINWKNRGVMFTLIMKV